MLLRSCHPRSTLISSRSAHSACRKNSNCPRYPRRRIAPSSWMSLRTCKQKRSNRTKSRSLSHLVVMDRYQILSQSPRTKEKATIKRLLYQAKMQSRQALATPQTMARKTQTARKATLASSLAITSMQRSSNFSTLTRAEPSRRPIFRRSATRWVGTASKVSLTSIGYAAD